MFTALDKALVAVVMGILSILSLAFGVDFGLDEKLVSGIIAAVTPVLVYFLPNKKA